MSELYYTQDSDSGKWLVWFHHPLGGKYVLEEFDSESEAHEFWQYQVNNQE